MRDQADVTTQRSGRLAEIVALDTHGARGGPRQRGSNADERRLARTIGAKEGEEFTLHHGQVYASKGYMVTERFGHLVHLYGRSPC